jgi:hypothetical protein
MYIMEPKDQARRPFAPTGLAELLASFQRYAPNG